LRALEKNTIPKNATEMEVDPEMNINVITSKNNSNKALTHALSNSFAFGGTNACLIISKG